MIAPINTFCLRPDHIDLALPAMKPIIGSRMLSNTLGKKNKIRTSIRGNPDPETV
jgi:hypothetical protein